MRLHRLKVTAFGPFSGSEEIDFTALGEAGLFLINGPTGAGKTSVLDAVCFALYGQVPGARNNAKALRSDHAAEGQGPSVELETSIRGRRFRITRSPQWERPKLRGSGTKLEQAHVLVEELSDGGWVFLTNRLDEAGDLVLRLLGMNAAQFCQVAMLPQGDFAAFLRASAEDRRKVLEKLFATEIYAAVEKWLADRRAATRAAAEQLEGLVERTADKIAEATGAVRPAEALLPWAKELRGDLDAVLTVTAELLQESEKALASARTGWAEGRERAERRERYEAGVRRRDALAERAPERAALAVRLEAADRAARVVPLGRAAVRRREVAADLAAKAERARSRAIALVPPCTCRDPEALFDTDCVCEPAEGQADVRLWRDELARLEGFRGHTAKHLQVQRDLRDRRAGLGRAEADEEKLAAELAELPGLVEAGRGLLNDARLQAAGIEAAVKAVEVADRLVEQGRRRDLVRHSLTEAETALREAVEESQRRKQTYLDLREQRLDGMAAVLAAKLVDGEPCGVCGSAEHPAPASGLGTVPSEDAERAAEQAAERAQRVREQAEVKVTGLRVELDSLLEATDSPVGALAEALDSARRDLEVRRTARLRCDELEAQLAAGETRLAEVRTRHTEAVGQRTELAAALKGSALEEERLRHELDRARGADTTLQARVQRLTAEAELVAAALTAAEQSETAQLELRKAEDELVSASADAGFAGPDEAAAAVVHDRAPLEERARRHDAEEAAVRELLADPALTSAAASPAVDLAALDGALRAAEAYHTRVAQAHDRARLRCDRLTDLTAHLAGQLRSWEPAAEAYSVVARLAGVASGQSSDNSKNMRLSAYVLSARLGQVVDAANERLGTMSAGRYLLRHSDERSAADRSRNSGGLGLRIVDGWTGQDRDPATLSGGESFITSLSLALGLADVVTAEAGGTEISTLFVDEGFGTLDEDTLDEVMDVLDSLRDGGRTVGVVSHVAELRVRIPAQLRLHKSRTGSRTSVHA